MQRKLDLRTGRPVWEAYRAPRVAVAPLKRDLKTEVLVIGMGIGGALAAQTLAAEGIDVAMIDRRGPILGSTAASTALVQYEIDVPLTLLTEKIGRAKAEAAWRRSRLALANLDALISDLDISCGLAQRDTLYLAGNLLAAKELEREAAARRDAGLAATFLRRGEMQARYGVDRAAILSRDNLALDPRKLTAGLLLDAQAHGVRMHSPSEAIDLVHNKDGVDVLTKAGPVIRAGRVILATGYELLDFVPNAAHQIVSTWAIATRPQKANLWKDAAMMWEASDPYLYLRATPDGRVICGGEDEEFSDEDKRDALLPAKSKRIAEKLAALLPRIDTRPEFAWTGSFGTTTTGLPMIGPVPHRPHIFAVMGYGGNGITYAKIAAESIRTWSRGGSDADADLFAL